MSLSRFIAMGEIASGLKEWRLKTRRLGMKAKALPMTKRSGMVGTAFDYLLRFELERRAPHAVTRPWIAEAVPDIIWRRNGSGAVGIDLLASVDPPTVSKRARDIVDKAKAAVERYVRSKQPTERQQSEIAGHAIRLAKLDDVYRSMKLLDTQLEDADESDIADLLSMLAIVPFDLLLHSQSLLLNP